MTAKKRRVIRERQGQDHESRRLPFATRIFGVRAALLRPGILMLAVTVSLATATETHEAEQTRPTAQILLRDHVVLHSATLTLADLLSESAPKTLRAEAGKIMLGAAPQPPLTRIIYRQQLQFLLQDHATIREELEIPPEIAVRRFYRVLTKEEVVRAIQQILGSEGSKDALNFTNVQFSTPVYVTTDDPGLRVIRIESDPLRHETRFRLWTSKEPRTLPFNVIVPSAMKLPVLVARHVLAPGEIVSATDFAVEMRPGAENLMNHSETANDLAGLETRAPLHSGQAVKRDDFQRPVLVEPGALATLIVQGSGFNIKTVVTPLEQGALGQEIRVRNTESRQVVEARVVGRDQLLKMK